MPNVNRMFMPNSIFLKLRGCDVVQISVSRDNTHLPVLACTRMGRGYCTQCCHRLISEAVGHSGWVPAASSIRKKAVIQILNILSKFIIVHEKSKWKFLKQIPYISCCV